MVILVDLVSPVLVLFSVDKKMADFYDIFNQMITIFIWPLIWSLMQ